MPSQRTLDCITMCIHCAQACTQCAHDCLRLGGEHASPAHQTLLHDCAECCTLVAHFLARNSHNSASMCKECLLICEYCAESCETFARSEGHIFLKECALTCLSCATACEVVAYTDTLSGQRTSSDRHRSVVIPPSVDIARGIARRRVFVALHTITDSFSKW